MTLREIADRLQSAAGVIVDHNAVGRYCNENNLLPEPRPKLPQTSQPTPQKQPKPSKQPVEKADTGETLDGRIPDGRPREGSAPDVEVPPAATGAPTIQDVTVEPQRRFPTAMGMAMAERSQAKGDDSAPLGPTPTSSAPQLAPPAERAPRRPVETLDEQTRANEVSNKHVSPVVQAPSVANKPPSEQARKPAASAPAEPPTQAPFDINAEIEKIKSLCGNQQEFLESLKRMIRWIEHARQSAPPGFHLMYDETLADLRKWIDAYDPERMKKRTPQEQAQYAILWQTRAAEYKAEHPETREPSHAPLFTPLEAVPVWTPDLELVNFGEDRFTLGDAVEGVAIFGSTGSGKTSGSGHTLACSYLSAGFGGLVLTAKMDECILWRQYAQITGRTPQLCVVKPGGPFRFNFLDYHTNLPEAQGGSTENVVELLFAILDAYAKTKPKASLETFWENTARQLLRNLIRVFRAAGEQVRLDKLRTFIAQAPQDLKSVKSGAYQPGPLFGRLLADAQRLSRGTANAIMIDEATHYWMDGFPDLNPKTRSIVVTHFTSMVDMFFEPQIWETFCGETTITPEAVFDGGVIVVDLPIEKYLSVGRIAAIIFKHFFQLAVARRTDPTGPSRRPVFLWVDEAQYFTTEHDSVFQATARGSKAATVYLTQNISNYYAQAGGDKLRVDGFFANLNTKIFHANNDPATNVWAAEMVGKATKYRASVSYQDQPPEPGKFSFRSLFRRPASNVTTNQHTDYEIQPADFSKLRTGGIHLDRPEDNLQVDAFLMKSGARFSNGKNFFRATFLQE